MLLKLNGIYIKSIGLLFGARGSASKFTVATLKSLKMTIFEIDQIVLQILKDSLQILQ